MTRRGWALLLFGLAFGYVEAAVVVDLRTIYAPLRERFYPGSAQDDLFPLITLNQLVAAGPPYSHLLTVEIFRELATLIMLGSVALAVAANAAQWLAAFGIVFGLWDIAFYAGLKIMLDWPASLWTWDLLFLIPVPWTGPVLAPVLVSLSMIAGGSAVLWREWSGRPVRVGLAYWLAILGGAVILMAAFMWDWRNVMAGGLPQGFPWAIFWAGEAIGVAGLLHLMRRNRV